MDQETKVAFFTTLATLENGTSADLEMIQVGLDALAELPPARRAQFAWGEQYLRRRKAVLEAKYIPR